MSPMSRVIQALSLLQKIHFRQMFFGLSLLACLVGLRTIFPIRNNTGTFGGVTGGVVTQVRAG